MRNFIPPHILFVPAILLSSCVPDDEPDDEPGEVPARGPDFEVRYHTKYLDIAPGFSQPVCRGSLDEMDRYMEAVADLLGIEIQQPTTVFWYNGLATGSLAERAEICDWCNGSCAGCYKGVVHSDFRTLRHELVHAVVTPAWGRSVRLFSEGIAHGLDWYLPGTSWVYPSMTNQVLLEIVGSGSYDSGHFSRWLIARFGPGKFSELFEPRLDQHATKEQVLDAVEDIYGLTFAELEAEYAATAAITYPLPGLCEGLMELPLNGDRWELNLTADCDAPHTFGPSGDGTNFVAFTIDVPVEFDGVPIAAWIPSDMSAAVAPCLDEPLYGVDFDTVRSTTMNNNGPTTFRRTGKHRVELPVVDAGDVYMRLCPANDKFPGSYPTDKSVDPENCVGD
ncbi:hypothetical protein [Enhygromyxa salina]|uniref:Lipoprotein n=1 Tax=Enhygromyxa salina TaxID=215803 RepID=A0A2S9YMJ9_9BACT|nr:hypothetical protein [Enhygromyxa salina]PRQ06305.1 hypothetical protein ENSA7_39820 [Enhygromyxa salina]